MKTKEDLYASFGPDDIQREVDEFNNSFALETLRSILSADVDVVATPALELYQYAMRGDLSICYEGNEYWFDDRTNACAALVETLGLFEQIHGDIVFAPAIELTERAAMARARVDFLRLGFEPLDGNYGISTREIAILCCMSEAGIRNALSKDPARPESTKVGKNLYFDPVEAHKWMLNRRGYIPTQLPEKGEELVKFRSTIGYGSAFPREGEFDDID